jgi:hypothetical protein
LRGVGQQHDAEDEVNVIDAVLEDPSTSTRRIASQLGLTQSFVWRTLHREELYPYHIQSVQALHPGDTDRRLTFCRWLLNQTTENPDFFKTILWSNEAQFARDGMNNMHNAHVWSIENPHQSKERRFQQRFSVNVWAGILNDQLLDIEVLDPRLNAERYLEFLENRLYDILGDFPIELRHEMWFQHDGAPPHNGRRVTEWLNRNYNNRWIGNRSNILWPPRSPDLNPLDFYLWGHLKQMVYSVPINTREQLMERIFIAAQEIRNQNVIHRVYDSLIRRCYACIRANGQQFEHLL